MSAQRQPGRPVVDAGVRVAAFLVAAEALALATVAGAELLSLNAARLGLGLTTTVFFLVCGTGLGWAATGLWKAQAWSRGPVVAAQLLTLGVAWSTRSLSWLAVVLALWGLVVLVLVCRRAAVESFSD